MTVASVNSALQRARPTLRDRLPRRRTEWTAEAGAREREVLGRYMAAAESLDLAAFTDLLSEDIRLTMPPNPYWFVGRAALTEFLGISLDPASPLFLGHWRHLPARANGQLAAGVTYDGPVRPCTAPRSSTYCGSRATASWRSPPSSRTSSRRSDCPCGSRPTAERRSISDGR